jgi:hypothetical protein
MNQETSLQALRLGFVDPQCKSVNRLISEQRSERIGWEFNALVH